MKVQFGPLKDGADWSALEAGTGARAGTPLANLLALFKSIGATSFILEGDHVDRDFSAAFISFYATLFTPYSKFCRRLHLFASDISTLLPEDDPETLALNLESQREAYLGYAVLRPLQHAPLGTAVVSATHFATVSTLEISIRAQFKVHVLGAELVVDGVPLTQQDTRVGACAQAAIWTVGRHLHARYGSAWFSMPDISELALKPTDAVISQSLPAGSAFLTLDNMVRAMRGMDRHPVVYARQGDQGWAAPPHEVVYRYLDSGIPLVLGLRRAGDGIGHAVVVVGREISTTVPNPIPGTPTLAEGVTHFLVADDQRGIFRKLPVRSENRSDEYPWTIEEDCEYIIVPLPSKVFLPAEVADTLSRDLLKSLVRQRDVALVQAGAKVLAEGALDAEFDVLALADQLVSRTYLTHGWRYRGRALRNSLDRELKRAIISHPLPRYVWVTEFSKPAESYDDDPCKARVQAHIVHDATGSQFWHSALIASAPGVAVLWASEPGFPQPEQLITVVATDSTNRSWPKVRGWTDFSSCTVLPKT